MLSPKGVLVLNRLLPQFLEFLPGFYVGFFDKLFAGRELALLDEN